MLDRAAFADQVRDALSRLYDPVHLQNHALADLLAARGLAPTERDARAARGRRLGQELRDAIDALKPTGDAGVAGRRHQAMLLRYVEGLDVPTVTARLAIGRSQFYEEHRQALDAVVSVLRERWGLDEPGWAAPTPGESTRPTARLPAPLTSFVGRERSLEVARAALAVARLVTLTGPPGAGKTRLAVAVAHSVVGADGPFPDGVHFVPLAGVADPELVVPTVATALGIGDAVGRGPLESLADALRDQAALLVLDNLEHVLPAAPAIGELLTRCPRLRVLTTSRAALRLPGEHELPVPPLALPDPDVTPRVERLADYEALQLFVERASAVRPAFALTEANAPAVVAICQRLDGLPLGIELAAARVRILSAEQIAERLGDRFRLLTGAVADVPHHRALRATMDWSHALLSPAEQTLLRRLSVFAGGFTLDAVEVVCVDATTPPIDLTEAKDPDHLLAAENLLDALDRLVGHSLVVMDETARGVRYHLLETVREYGRERLRDAGEEVATRDRHLAWCVGSAEAVPVFDFDASFAAGEQDNLRAGLQWSIERDDPQSGYRMYAAGFAFWYLHGQYAEGRAWFDELARLPGALDRTSPRAAALNTVGYLAYLRGDLAFARACLDESRPIAEETGDGAVLAIALHLTAILVFSMGEPSRSAELFEAARAINVRLGRREWAIANGLVLTRIHESRGDVAAARVEGEKCLAEARATGFTWGIAGGLDTVGLAMTREGELDRARPLLEESVGMRRGISDNQGTSRSLTRLAELEWRSGDAARAGTLLGEALDLARAVGLWRNALTCLRLLVEILVVHDPASAVRLASSAAAVRRAVHASPLGTEADELVQLEAAARAVLSPAIADAASAEGAAMTLDQTVAAARELAARLTEPYPSSS